MRLKLFLLAAVCASQALPQSANPPGKETLTYSIEWRLITAGRARLEWSVSPRSGWEGKLHLESVGLVSKLFRVEDDYAASMSQGLCVASSQLSTLEGSRQRETRISFDYNARKASYLERDKVKNVTVASHEIDIPGCVHDVVGGLYYLRTLNIEQNQSAQIPLSDGKKTAMVKVEAQGREAVKTPAGSFKTMRYEVFLFDNVLYRRSARAFIWLTDDSRKLPVQVRVKMQFTIGTITLQLEKVE